MIIHVLITIVFYFIILYLSVNLLGLLVRGLFTNPELDRLKQEGSEFIKHEVEKTQRAEKWVNIVALIFLIAYFYLLYRFWNIGVVLAAIMIMAGRLPVLIWEIKHGMEMNRTAVSNLMPHNAWYYLSVFLPWAGLPVLYYSLYYLGR